MHAAIRQAVRSGALRSAHDVAEGGLAVALAECCLAGGHGAEVTSTRPRTRCSARAPARSSSPGPHDAFAAFGAAATVIGIVGGDELRIAAALSVPVASSRACTPAGWPGCSRKRASDS